MAKQAKIVVNKNRPRFLKMGVVLNSVFYLLFQIIIYFSPPQLSDKQPISLLTLQIHVAPKIEAQQFAVHLHLPEFKVLQNALLQNEQFKLQNLIFRFVQPAEFAHQLRSVLFSSLTEKLKR